jgi:D-beta-D-heptose 7-phosphate kinase / D-beta-D-heptose 1-phosphate adenosyltransferase
VKRVLVIGDVIADIYNDVHTVAGKFCPDDLTVPVCLKGDREVRPGGAANVAVNLAALAPDVVVDLIGAVTPEVAAAVKRVARGRVMLQHSLSFLSDHAGLQKQRLFVDGKLRLRVDNRQKLQFLHDDDILECYRSYRREVNRPDLIIASDYGAGTINPSLVEVLVRDGDRLFVDTKMTDLRPFAGTLAVKLNELEWRNVLESDAVPERHFRWMVVTTGSRGATLTWQIPMNGGSVTHTVSLPAYDVPIRDVCGSGDTFLAGMAAGFLSTGAIDVGLQWGNAAAATVVSQSRTAIASREQMFELLKRELTDEARG